MTKEEKAPLEPKVEEKSETQDDSSQENAEEESSESTSQDEKVDYQALLQAEKERAEKAERALAEDRYKASKKKREEIVEEHSDDSEGDEDKPLTAKELQQILARERQATQKDYQQLQALDVARANTSSEDEAQAALLFWKTRVVSTGNLEEDIRFAVAGLNYRKTVAKNAELARALRSKDMSLKDTAMTHRDATVGVAPKLSSGDTASYKRAGFEYDNMTKVWKKKLPNGKFLIKDPRTKQTRMQ